MRHAKTNTHKFRIKWFALLCGITMGIVMSPMFAYYIEDDSLVSAYPLVVEKENIDVTYVEVEDINATTVVITANEVVKEQEMIPDIEVSHYPKPEPIITPKPVIEKPAPKKEPSPIKVPAGEAQNIAYDMVQEYGWSDAEFTCLVDLWQRESNWNHLAENPSSGAYGIPQSLPGSKMASAGDDWRTNPTTQISWGLGYIKNRYGTPCGAWDHSERIGWY